MNLKKSRLNIPNGTGYRAISWLVLAIIFSAIVCPNANACFAGPGLFVQDSAVAEKKSEKVVESQGDESKTAPPKPKFDLAIQLESFDMVWDVIKKSHWDEEVSGKKWDETRELFRPQAEKCTSASEVRKVLEKMLGTLNQSHFGIIPNTSYGDLEEQMATGGAGFSGLVVRLVEEKLVITRVTKDSPADKAGIRAGWIIQGMIDNDGNTKNADDLIEKVKKSTEHSVMRLETVIGLVGSAITTGKVGSKVHLICLDETDDHQAVDFELVKGPGLPTKFGNLPMFSIEFDSKRLEGDIGYVSFNAFFNPKKLVTGFRKAVTKEYKNSKGLIIDMRGNRGGMVGLTMGLSGWFVKEKLSLGKMKLKSSTMNLRLNPRRPTFDKPVVVLVDECSISAAEVWSGGLQDLGLAHVIGARSAGLVLPSNVTKLPNGDGFQYAIADYHSASGKTLERDGVMPDQVISLQRETLFGNQDPVVNAAKKWILEQSKQQNN